MDHTLTNHSKTFLDNQEEKLLTQTEQYKLLVEWNNTQSDYPIDKCIHQLFEEQVKRSPNSIAVVFEGEQLTYRELNAKANQLAHYLQALGVKPEVLVGICVERSLEMLVGLLGILKAGGAYVPLDPTYPYERLAYMLSDSQVQVLLTDSKLVNSLATPKQVICLDQDWGVISQHSKQNLVIRVESSNLAYVIYTSGSTGKPKGVAIEHRALVNHMSWMQATFPVEATDKLLQKTPFGFDASVWEFYAPLLVGGQLIIAQPGRHRNAEYLARTIHDQKITILQGVPSLLQMLLQTPTFATCSSLKRIYCGGEALPVKLVQQCRDSLSAEVINLYGPTEATIDTTYSQCVIQTDQTMMPIGRPISNTQVYILDRHLQPLPINVPGELYIGGDGLARGYLNRPDLTNEKFIPNPFSNQLGSRLYKTGDLARYLADGNIEFLGRVDNQVKIRGFRIELEEIEAALLGHPNVRDAVVIVREDVPGNKRLVAYVVVQPQNSTTPASENECYTEHISQWQTQDENICNQTSTDQNQLIPLLGKFLQEKLPNYMVPARFVMLDALPLTPNGKVDRRALPMPDWARSDLGEHFVAPRTSLEKVLAKIWVEVLELEQVGIHDKFLELGGHSLLAAQIISRLRDTLQVNLSVDSLFTSPTIAQLAISIEAVDSEKKENFTPPIQRVSRSQNLPLSWGQEQLWFFAQLERDIPVYNEPCTIHLRGFINVNALEKALNEVIKRHDNLRSRFITVDGQPLMVIAPPSTFNLPVVDLRQLPLEKREAKALQLATEEAKQIFDLTCGSLLRATLVQLADEDYRLFLTFHHIIIDGVSLYSVFLPELATLYEAFCAGRISPLVELPIQYPDFSSWQRQWFTEEILQNQLDYWKQQLTDLPILQLPYDRPRRVKQTFRGARHCFALSKDLTEALKTLSHQEGVTLYMTLLAVFKTLLYRYTEQDDIVVGTVSAGRNRPEVEKLMGYFLNTLVLRTDLSGFPSFQQLLSRVRSVTLEAYAHEDLPYQKLVETLQPERNLSQNPLFQAAFVLEPPVPCLSLDWTISQLDIQTDTAKFDLTLGLDSRPECIIGYLEYNTDLFDASTILRMIEHFRTLLSGIVTNPKAQISELPMLTEAERQQLLVEWNNTQTQYAQDKCIHQLFEEQVDCLPDAVAVVFEGEQLTYRELNARANQLAHHLQTLGVEPETLVGICVERSLEMVVGLLGILKAGGTYVPLDPEYPSERLAFMLEDSRAQVLLTETKLMKKLPQYSEHIICLDSDWEEIAEHNEENPYNETAFNNLAYVIYTSGSTGKPKGVAIMHRGVVRLVKASYISFSAEEIFLQLAPISFDASTFEIWGSLLNGGLLVIMPPHKPSLQELGQALVQYQITTLWLTAGLFHLMVDEQLESLKNVRQLLAGGDVLSVPHVKKALQELKGCTLINGYGPTENTTFTCCCTITDFNSVEDYVPIGHPIANTQVYVLDKNLQPVPIGIVGELCISGDGLARGYLNLPDLTDEKFIPNLFSNQPDSRLYKTGDLARYLADGNIEFVGRIDNQVKIRGFRIELGEIEAAISQHPSVKETTVIAREDIASHKFLAAYIVSFQPLTYNDLRNFLLEKLPDYMIPAAFIMLDALPLTPNGKIDRRALPAPDASTLRRETAFIPPRTSTEKILATTWAEVLQLEQVGIQDNFFELGGDSILSIQIVARCNTAGLKLTPKDLFRHQTIASLAQVVSKSEEIQAEQGIVTGAVPLTPILNWFLEQKLPEPNHFNQSFIFEVSKELKPELLKQALQQLLVHHDALRLRLIAKSDNWQLQNAAFEETEFFSIVDLSGIAASEQTGAIEAAATELQANLNLSSGSIIKVTLFNLGNDQPNRLLIIIHHIAVDGVSWRILLEDLATAYQQIVRSQAIVSPAKTTSFQDWAVRLTEYANSQKAVAELNYWLAQFDCDILPLPLDYPLSDTENTIADAAQISVSLNAEQTLALLKEVPKAYNTQINDVLLAALLQCFAQWTGQSSLLINLEGHGREELFEDVNLSRTVGWFTSIFPVLLKLDKTDLPLQLLKSVKEQLRHIPQHGIGYGILRYLSSDQTTSLKLQHLPTAQVSFNYLGQFDTMLNVYPILGLASESAGSPVSLKNSRSHLLEVDGFVAEGKLKLTWTYNQKLHQRATVERLAQGFIEALTALISDCLSSEVGGYTPSDFPEAELTQEELDAMVESLTPKTQIESIYPLSPTQQGMLFHTLYAPNSGVYFVQSVFTLSGNLNILAFEQAWQKVVELHPILRTLFVWKNRQHPLQVVCKTVNLPWNNYDWHPLSSGKQEEGLFAFLQAERERGFELDKSPLMRCTLIRVADNTYQFIWSHHHLLMDGWCLAIILKEVWSFYEAIERGENLYLNPPPPYRNYIAWLQQQDKLAAQNFWRSTLAGFTAPTPLIVDKSVGNLSEQKAIYNEQNLKLSASLTNVLKQLARQNHLTLNTLAQGVWALLLSRYSGELDVVFGATVSGRPPALLGVESMVGLFINTLPVRVQVSPETELLSWLKQLQVSQTEREQYSYSSLVEIQGFSDVPRNMPLFNSIVVFENYPVDSSFLKGKGSVEISNVRAFERTNYPLTVVVLPNKELSIQISYDTSQFDDDAISRMLGHLQTLLLGIVANPQGQVCELPLLTQSEKQQLLVEWNNTLNEYPQDKCIHQLFEEQVERSPDAVAIVFEGEQITYQELNAKANQLAHYLQALGVEPEVLVGICVERSLEMVVGLLGILKAGGAYVPLDPAFPKERLAFMLQDSRVPVLLTGAQQLSKLPPSEARVVCLDKDWSEIAQCSPENPKSKVAFDNLVYAIYTSGSTGNPKGVLIEHQGLLNLVKWHQRTFAVSPADRATQLAAAAFDASVWELWPYLTAGASIYIADEQTRVLPQLLQDWLLKNAITICFLPTPLAESILRLDWSREVALRILLTGGDKLHNYPLPSIPFELVNNYGLTENTVVTTSGSIRSGQQTNIAPSIGRPIANTQVYVLDADLQLVPIGVSGELYIGGDGLARGYLNLPDLTAEKFIPNPFSNQPGSRLYKTGDLARYLEDSNIEFLGRIDNQVKIRGFRIELGEIESVLAKHSAVKETVVIARENIVGGKQLVAYIVPHEELTPTIDNLRGFLKEQLPDYMIPSAFVILDSLPLTPNGKLDCRALPEPELQLELELTFVAPRTPIEEILADIWASVLVLKQVGIYDNFFEIGGHSLIATQVISRVCNAFSVEIPLRRLFEAPTIAQLQEYIQAALTSGQSTLAPPLVSILRPAQIPLSFAQARLWFLDQLQPENGFYNIPLVLRLSGQLNVAALEQSLNEIIRRHESLRTNFTTEEGQPVQIVATTLNLQLVIVDLQNLPACKQEVETQQLVSQLAVQHFDLKREPLLRANVLKLSSTEHVFVLVLHHIIADGWSLGVLEQELATYYEAFCNGLTPVLPELPIQYADFALWQRNWLNGEVLQTQLNYWQQQLEGIPILLELPTDRLRPATQSYRGAHLSVPLSAQLSEELASLSKRAGVTLFMTLLAAFQVLLYRYTGSDDIVVGTPIANRNRQEIEGLIGFFVNTLVLRTDLSGNPSFELLLGRVREVTLGAYAHQDLPFEELVQALQPERSLSYSPLFQVMFILQNAPMSEMVLPELTISSLQVETQTARFDLILSMQNTSSGLIGEWEYNSDLFDANTVQRMAEHFQTLLEAIVANFQQPISKLPLLTEKERRLLLVEWNNTISEKKDVCIHQMFEAIVEQTPETVAVVFEGKQLTYKELNARANQLAHYLRNYGVEKDVPVGICVERSLEMVVGILGILKAGGTYVPLDPSYPSERLAFMLENAQAQVLLTQQFLVESLVLHKASTICLDSDWEVIAQQSEQNPACLITSDNLAYVIYTSGSTGQPKGVAMSHRSLSNLIKWQVENSTLSREAKTLQLSPISFDVSFQEIFSTWCSGGTLVLISDQVRRDPVQLWRFLTNQAIARLFLPFVALQQLAEVADTQQIVPISLREIITAGEQLLISTQIKKLFTKLKNCTLQNQYGPSESHLATAYTLKGSPSYWPAFPPIGRPITNTQIYILNSQLQPVPIGVPGELYIGGVALARGYFNRPSLTDERFISNPFSNKPEGRLYKTGDKARYLLDGNIEYLGRIDEQVKIRGFRIELGEIEAVLAQHPDVIQTVVAVREDIPGDKRLVAYVVSKLIPERLPYISECQLKIDGNLVKLFTEDICSSGVGLVGAPAIVQGNLVRLHLLLPGEDEARLLCGTVAWSRPPQAGIQFQLMPTEQTTVDQSVAYLLETKGFLKAIQRTISRNLRDYLKEKLPEYMIPSAFVLVKALPLTPSGKVDRRLLPTPNNSVREVEDKFVVPSTPTEEVVAVIWLEVLRLQQVGINDNFFELGGHSLLATQIISRIREAFSIELPLYHLFESPTIASLSRVIEIACSAQSKPQLFDDTAFISLPPLAPTERNTCIPLSFAQEHIWSAHQLYPHSCAYNIPITLRFTQSLSKEVLELSINEIIRRHEILRTTFIIKEGQPVQVITESLTLPLEIVDLQDLSNKDREVSVQKLADQEARHHFDLASGPLIKTTLLRLSTTEYWLFITIHHIITDGWSIGIFLGELEALYSAFLNGLPSQLPELPVQYADFTLWQRKWLNEQVLQKQFSYWQKKLANFPTSLDLLPIAQPHHSNNRRASFHSIVLPKSLVTSLKALSRSQGVTIFVILVTALKILLFKLSGQTDVIVGSTTANRSMLLIEQMMGCFIKDVILRSQVNGNQTGLTLLKQVKQTVSEAINNQELTLEKLNEILSSVEFLRTVIIIMAPPIPNSSEALHYELVSPLQEGELWDDYTPLALHIPSPSEDCNTIEIQGNYNTNFFSHKTIEQLFIYYQEIIQKLVHQPKTKLQEFDVFCKSMNSK